MNAAATQSVLAPVLEFLRRHAPFDRMGEAHQEFLAKRLKLGFYAKGEVITSPEEGPAGRFFIIKEGRVRGESPAGEGSAEEGAWELVAGECFPIGALLSRRPVHLVQRAAEDAFCYELDRLDFDQLRTQSAVFQDFCSRRLANLLDLALRDVQASHASRAGDAALGTPLHELVRREPVSCTPATPLCEALAQMDAAHVGSIVVVDEAGRPQGVFTLHDLLSRVVLPGLDLARPVAEAMSGGPVVLGSGSYAFEAALLMTERGFGHVCVVDDGGRLTGVVSERDLFALQRVGLVNLRRAIDRASDLRTLTALGRDVHALIDQMLAQGASVEQLTQLVTALNDQLTRRVIALETAGEALPPFTWLSFGSEGRHEQTLKTDQDNGILFIPPAGEESEAVRARLLPAAQRINQALDHCGFPLCKGGVMAGNPECCLSLEEWQHRFGRWIDQGTPEHLLKATIYFDFRPLHGDPAPAAELRRWLTGKVAENSRFRRQMAANALRSRPPLGLIRDFVLSSGGDHPHTIDLKVQGVAPFVDGARLIALAHRIDATNTVARLRGAAAAGKLRSADVAAWAEAYYYIQLLRMRAHRRQAEEGQPLSNHVDPDGLNELDRRILKEAFRQARKIQAKLTLEYQL